MSGMNKPRIARNSSLKAVTRTIALADIVVDDSVQSRTAIDEATVDSYCLAMEHGAKFPAVVVFLNTEGDFVLADGFHRVEGAKRAGLTEIVAEVQPRRDTADARHDAAIYAAGANALHGLRRTNADKRRAVAMVLREMPKWSDRKIAKHCGVHHQMVGIERRALDESSTPTADRTIEKPPEDHVAAGVGTAKATEGDSAAFVCSVVALDESSTAATTQRETPTAPVGPETQVSAPDDLDHQLFALTSNQMDRLAAARLAHHELVTMLRQARRDLDQNSRDDAAWGPIRCSLLSLHKNIKESWGLPACPKAPKAEMLAIWIPIQTFLSTRLEQDHSAAVVPGTQVSAVDDLDDQCTAHIREVDTLPETAKNKLDRLRERQQKLQDLQFEKAVIEAARVQLPKELEVLRLATQRTAAAWQEGFAQRKANAEQLSDDDYHFLLALLHPDRAPEDRREKFARGLGIVRKLDNYINQCKKAAE